MQQWTDGELARIGAADELQVTSLRPDGTMRPLVTIWGVRHGGAIYVRSASGSDNGWFRRARRSGAGQLRAGGITRGVTFDVPGAGAGDADIAVSLHDDLDAAHHAKYDRYGPGPVGTVTGAAAPSATLRLLPRG